MIPALIVTGVLIVALVIGFLVVRQRADSTWQQLAGDMGAKFVPGGLFALFERLLNQLEG